MSSASHTAPPAAPDALPAPAWTRPKSRPRITAFELAFVVLVSSALLVPGLWRTTLIDPWETHYGEVAREMLAHHDWVHTTWEYEGFRSKPALTMWMDAIGLRSFGFCKSGCYSGELTTSPLVEMAVRLPFALFGVLGLVLMWYALAQLVDRKMAWLSLLIIGTCPFYFFITRQAIPDGPMVDCLIGAMACFALASESGDERSPPLWRRVTAHHLFLGALTLFVSAQIIYYALYFQRSPHMGPGVLVRSPELVLVLPTAICLAVFLAWSLWLQPVRTRRQVYMYWFYALVGISVLAKGPPGLAVAGITCLLYLVVTGNWRLLLKVEIPRGIFICALIAVPWHVAMWMKDGATFLHQYFGYHIFGRAFRFEDHSPGKIFAFYVSELGIGMWPWAGLVPAAVAAAFMRRRERTREDRIRLIALLWAAGSMAFFCLVPTKFHHYIFPAVPALAVLVAFWLGDLLSGRAGRSGLVLVLAAVIIAFICRDLIGEQKQFIELFCYRYDRPWPSGPPWNVDLSPALLAFGALFTLSALGLALRRLRWLAFGVLIAASVAFAFWGMNAYMGAAAPHWGQRHLHRTYYRLRHIHGVDIKYGGLRDVADDWGPNAPDYMVQSVLPENFKVGQPAIARLIIPGVGLPKNTVVLHGTVSRKGHDRFWIHIPAAEKQKIAPLVARGRKLPKPRQRPWVQVNADRLIAWNLYWRGEDFWSNGEIWGKTYDTRTVFHEYNDKSGKKFQAYLKAPDHQGKTYYLITIASRVHGLKGKLPTQRAKQTFQVLDTSCNKYTLVRFTL